MSQQQPAGRAVVRGSVRVVRTFRLTPTGQLVPITRRPAWSAGVNTATCYRHRRREPLHVDEPAPAVGCTCGFWGYGNLQALRESGLDHQGKVVAVIACHGTVIPAVLGVRAQHAQIEAVWLSERVNDATAAQVATAHPSTAVYRSLPAMLGEHPLTELSTYQLPSPPRPGVVRVHLLAALGWLVAVLACQQLASPLAMMPATLTPTPWTGAAVVLPLSLAMIFAFGVLVWPQHWRRGQVALGVYTAVLLAGWLTLPPWVFSAQLTTSALAGVLHLGALTTATRYLLRPQRRPHRWARRNR